MSATKIAIKGRAQEKFSQSDLAATSRYRDPIPGKWSLQGQTD